MTMAVKKGVGTNSCTWTMELGRQQKKMEQKQILEKREELEEKTDIGKKKAENLRKKQLTREK